MAVTCINCSQTIPAEDVNLQALLAKCRACNEVFGIGGLGGTSDPTSKANVERPGGIRLEEDVAGIRMVRKWRTTNVAFLVLFTLFWDGFLVFWYFLAFTQGGPMMMKVFPVLHVAAGVFMTWYTLAVILNRTTVEVNYEQVCVRHAPVWWPGNRTLVSASIKHLRVKPSDLQRDDKPTWNVMVDTTDDERLALVANLDDRDQAEYIRQELGRFLDL